MKILLSFLSFFIMFSCVTVKANEIKVWQKEVKYVPFSNENLTLLSVVYLSALDGRFGGLSGLLEDNGVFYAVSDRGFLFKWKNKSKIKRVEFKKIKDQKNQIFHGIRFVDSESLARHSKSGVWVAFERQNRLLPIEKETAVQSAKELHAPFFDKLPFNGGFEAVEEMADGRLVLIAEGFDNATETDFWLQQKDGTWQQKKLLLTDAFRPTGLTRLPESNTFILMERFYKNFQGFKVRLSVFDIEQGVRSKILAELSAPYTLDNFEGIASYIDDQGRVILTLVSDDNFSPLQRTLLMRFQYHGAK